MTREQKIAFLVSGEKELGGKYNIKYTDKFGDFSTVSDKALDEMVEELDWI